MIYRTFSKIVTKWDAMLLQSGTAFQLTKLEVVRKGDSFFITKWDGSCYKAGQVLQSETDVVTKWDRCYKVRPLLQSGL